MLEQRGLPETLLAGMVAGKSARGRVPPATRREERGLAQQPGEPRKIAARYGEMAQGERRSRAEIEAAALSRDAEALPLLQRTWIAGAMRARSAEADGEKRDSPGREIRSARRAGLPGLPRRLRMTACRPCADQLLSVAAERIVGKTPMCDAHYRSAKGLPKLETTRGEKEMRGKQTTEAERAEVLKLANEGMNIEQIRKQLGMGWITVANIVRGTGAKPAKRGRTAKSAGKSPALRGSGQAHRGSGQAGNGAMSAMEELCEALWTALPLEKKAALLKRMHEVN